MKYYTNLFTSNCTLDLGNSEGHEIFKGQTFKYLLSLTKKNGWNLTMR